MKNRTPVSATPVSAIILPQDSKEQTEAEKILDKLKFIRSSFHQIQAEFQKSEKNEEKHYEEFGEYSIQADSLAAKKIKDQIKPLYKEVIAFYFKDKNNEVQIVEGIKFILEFGHSHFVDQETYDDVIQDIEKAILCCQEGSELRKKLDVLKLSSAYDYSVLLDRNARIASGKFFKKYPEDEKVENTKEMGDELQHLCFIHEENIDNIRKTQALYSDKSSHNKEYQRLLELLANSLENYADDQYRLIQVLDDHKDNHQQKIEILKTVKNLYVESYKLVSKEPIKYSICHMSYGLITLYKEGGLNNHANKEQYLAEINAILDLLESNQENEEINPESKLISIKPRLTKESMEYILECVELGKLVEPDNQRYMTSRDKVFQIILDVVNHLDEGSEKDKLKSLLEGHRVVSEKFETKKPKKKKTKKSLITDDLGYERKAEDMAGTSLGFDKAQPQIETHKKADQRKSEITLQEAKKLEERDKKQQTIIQDDLDYPDKDKDLKARESTKKRKLPSIEQGTDSTRPEDSGERVETKKVYTPQKKQGKKRKNRDEDYTYSDQDEDSPFEVEPKKRRTRNLSNQKTKLAAHTSEVAPKAISEISSSTSSVTPPSAAKPPAKVIWIDDDVPEVASTSSDLTMSVSNTTSALTSNKNAKNTDTQTTGFSVQTPFVSPHFFQPTKHQGQLNVAQRQSGALTKPSIPSVDFSRPFTGTSFLQPVLPIQQGMQGLALDLDVLGKKFMELGQQTLRNKISIQEFSKQFLTLSEECSSIAKKPMPNFNQMTQRCLDLTLNINKLTTVTSSEQEAQAITLEGISTDIIIFGNDLVKFLETHNAPLTQPNPHFFPRQQLPLPFNRFNEYPHVPQHAMLFPTLQINNRASVELWKPSGAVTPLSQQRRILETARIPQIPGNQTSSSQVSPPSGQGFFGRNLNQAQNIDLTTDSTNGIFDESNWPYNNWQ